MTTVTKAPSVKASTRTSLVIYLGLIACLVLVKVVLEVASIEGVVESQAGLFSWELIGFIAVVGGFCVWLGPRAGLPDLWGPSISPRQRLVLPAALGLGLGAIALAVNAFVGFQRIVAEAGNIPTINVPFPESLIFYSGGAIIVESLYRLILITLPLWLIGTVILRGRGQTAVFWSVALLTSLVESYGQMTLVAGHPGVMAAMGVSMYALNVGEAFLFRRYGFLAPLTFRLSYYLVWHGVASMIGL
jgi:hypothetical protein